MHNKLDRAIKKLKAMLAKRNHDWKLWVTHGIPTTEQLIQQLQLGDYYG